MKKKYLIGILALVLCFVLIGCGKKDESELDKIAKIFNNSATAKTYKEYGYEINAKVKGNKLVITNKTENGESSVSYELVGNILSNDTLKEEDLITTAILIDSVGQLQGYKDGELAENLNAFPDEIGKYTIDKEGFELKDNNDTVSIKIDISKKIPLKDLSNLYLKTDQFDMIKEIVEENSVGNQTGKVAKLAYNVEVSEDKNSIYIGERDKLTDSAYKSILSVLEVIYGTQVADKFKTVYPSFKDGKTTIDDFTINTNYKIKEKDSIFKDMKVVLVTIDNNIKKN